MGMDVYGKNPKSKKGSYFRNNVWWWHPLWDYCLEVSNAAKKVELGHSNDGDGLGKRDTEALVRDLEEAIESGHTAAYEDAYKNHLENLPLVKCDLCEGTGKRQEPPQSGAGDYPCNACDGKGEREARQTSYPFSEENVKEFVEFLRDSGGFEIC